MFFNEKGNSLEIVFEDSDTDLEKRFVKNAFDTIKSQAIINKMFMNLVGNVVLKEPRVNGSLERGEL